MSFKQNNHFLLIKLVKVTISLRNFAIIKIIVIVEVEDEFDMLQIIIKLTPSLDKAYVKPKPNLKFDLYSLINDSVSYFEKGNYIFNVGINN